MALKPGFKEKLRDKTTPQARRVISRISPTLGFYGKVKHKP